MNSMTELSVTLPPLPGGFKQRFHAMIKPASSLCNLDRIYSYCLHKQEQFHWSCTWQMSDDILKQHCIGRDAHRPS